MGNIVSVKITGLEELEKKFSQLAPQIADQIAKEAVEEGSAIVKNEMVAQAPRATGFLASHFDVVFGKGGKPGNVTAAVGPNSKAVYPPRQTIGNIVNKTFGLKAQKRSIPAFLVAKWVERGHKLFHGTKRKGRTYLGATKPNPFMTRAFEMTYRAAVDKVTAIIIRGIERLNHS